MATHHVNKLLLDFSFTTNEKETALLQTKHFFYEKALPQLNAGFDNIIEPLYINKLEINVGQTTTANFENDFLKAFRKSLEIFKPLPTLRNEDPLTEEPNFTFDHILYFLERGYWPWNFQQMRQEEILSLIKPVFKIDGKLLYLFEVLTARPLMAERLTLLVFGNTSIRQTLIAALLQYHPALQNVLPLLPTAWKTKVTGHESFYFLFVRKLFTSSPIYTDEEMLIALQDIIQPLSFSLLLNEAGYKNKSNRNTAENPLDILKKFFIFIDKKDAEQLFNKQGMFNKIINRENEIEPIFNEENEQDKITINNAGLILFHPYLLPVFNDLQWLNVDKKFISKRVQQKAVMFLQYLVNGKSRQAEHLLVLNKILCNWPVHLPLQTSVNFSPKEKAAAKDVLESLREHWPIMKNTSNRGLVESFVNRPALLQKTSAGFLLQVEKKTIDILMDTLPFGISIIKLPWNEYLIYTEW